MNENEVTSDTAAVLRGLSANVITAANAHAAGIRLAAAHSSVITVTNLPPDDDEPPSGSVREPRRPIVPQAPSAAAAELVFA